VVSLGTALAVALGAAAVVVAGVVGQARGGEGDDARANGTACANDPVNYVEITTSSVSPAISLPRDEALTRASAIAGFRVTSPCVLPAGMVLDRVSVGGRAPSNPAAELIIVPRGAPYSDEHPERSWPTVRITQTPDPPQVSGGDRVDPIHGSATRLLRLQIEDGLPGVPGADGVLYYLEGPHSRLLAGATGLPGTLPSHAAMTDMIASLFY
jgi:hypothetical protein